MAILRRVIFNGFILISILFFFYTSFNEYLTIEISSCKDLKEGILLKSDEEKLEEIYNNLINYKNYGKIEKIWKKKISSDKYPPPIFFFKPEELSFLKNFDYLKENQGELFFDLGNGKILKATFLKVSMDDFAFGSGFTGYPDPPNYILYPLRKFSFPLFLLAFLLYFLIPFKKSLEDSVKYPKYRFFLLDFLIVPIFFFFFALPLFITGGLKQAISFGLPLTIPLWLISSFGFFIIFLAIWQESYGIDLKEDGIIVYNFKGKNFYPFNEIDFYQEVNLKPPKGLVFFSFIFSFVDKRNLGKALLLISSKANAIYIKMKNEKEIYIFIADQMGNKALKGFEKLMEFLKEKSVKFKNEVKEIRSFGFEFFRN